MRTATVRDYAAEIAEALEARRVLHGGIILETPMRSTRGARARAILFPHGSGRTDSTDPTISVQQEIDGRWHGTPGSWFLSTLAESEAVAADRIAIDWGAGWFVDGIGGAVAEALDIIDF